MNNTIGNNILRYRKERKMTQSELAQKIGVTFQAISKWETGHSVPETSNMSSLAAALEVSIDTLLGYKYMSQKQSDYDQLYKDSDYYWGVQPTELSIRVLTHMPPVKNTKLLDAGCREGQNSLFFARNGYHVTGVDISETGIQKAIKLLGLFHLSATFIQGSIVDFVPNSKYDVIFCDEILHLIRPDHRSEAIEKFKQCTRAGGINCVCVPVYKPYVSERNPGKVFPWYSGELFRAYHDWQILECTETEPITINHNTYPRVYNFLVAKKPL